MQSPIVRLGESAFFSPPHENLNPALWDSDEHLLPNIRKDMVRDLEDTFTDPFNDPLSWSTLWLMGSSTSYQYGTHEDIDMK